MITKHANIKNLAAFVCGALFIYVTILAILTSNGLAALQAELIALRAKVVDPLVIKDDPGSFTWTRTTHGNDTFFGPPYSVEVDGTDRRFWTEEEAAEFMRSLKEEEPATATGTLHIWSGPSITGIMGPDSTIYKVDGHDDLEFPSYEEAIAWAVGRYCIADETTISDLDAEADSSFFYINPQANPFTCSYFSDYTTTTWEDTAGNLRLTVERGTAPDDPITVRVYDPSIEVLCPVR